jgi:hypothetical protein
MGTRPKKPRELLDTDVEEVSLVDKAANRRRFLVTKRRNPLMSAFETITKNAGADGADAVDTEKAKGGGKMPPALAEALQRAKTAKTAEEIAKAGADIEKAMEALATEKAEAEKAAAAAAAEKAKTEKAEPVAKSLHEVLADMGQTAIAVSKGQVVTEARAKSLFDGLEKMSEAAFEMDPVSFAAYLEKMAMLPSNATVRSAVRPQGAGGTPDKPKMGEDSPIKKAEDDTPPAWVVELKKSIDDQGARLEKIEKARGEPANASPNGGDETTTEVKKNEGFWNGIGL